MGICTQAMAPVVEGEHEGRPSVSGSPPRGHADGNIGNGNGTHRQPDAPNFFYGRIVNGPGPSSPETSEVYVNPLLVANHPGVPISAFADSPGRPPEAPKLQNGTHSPKPGHPEHSLI